LLARLLLSLLLSLLLCLLSRLLLQLLLGLLLCLLARLLLNLFAGLLLRRSARLSTGDRRRHGNGSTNHRHQAFVCHFTSFRLNPIHMLCATRRDRRASTRETHDLDLPNRLSLWLADAKPDLSAYTQSPTLPAKYSLRSRINGIRVALAPR